MTRLGILSVAPSIDEITRLALDDPCREVLSLAGQDTNHFMSE